MGEILAEIRVRSKNEITIPSIVRDVLNLSSGDIIRFENILGNICICKVITRKINNKCGGEGAGEIERRD